MASRHSAVLCLLAIIFLSQAAYAACPDFSAPVNYGAPTVQGWYSAVAIGDLNGDGRLDLAIADLDAATVSILLGNGDGTFPATATNIYGTGSSPYSVAIEDFNGDGKADLAVANSGSNSVSILLGNGDGTFATKVDYTSSAFDSRPVSVGIGDFNGDGKPDLAVANSNSSNVSILLGNGNGTFATFSSYPLGIAQSYQAVCSKVATGRRA